MYAYKAMNAHIQTSIESEQSTVILVSSESVFTTQLAAAITAVHLQVEIFDPKNLPKLLIQERVRNLFKKSYVCVWIDIPIFVGQREKQETNERVLRLLQNMIHIPLHVITFDAAYERKNGREGGIPTIASRQLLSTVLQTFPRATCFLYSHVVYPYEGGVSLIQRFLVEKIEQGKRFPLHGSWTPVWYADVISHFVSTLYDLTINGGEFSGSFEISLESFESAVRKESHHPDVSGKQIDFPFQFKDGKPIGKTQMKTMVEELALIIPLPTTTSPTVSPVTSTVFIQKKQAPRKKRVGKLSLLLKIIAGTFATVAVSYACILFLFFALLGNLRSQIMHHSAEPEPTVWSTAEVKTAATKITVLEKIAQTLPLPYGLVGIQLPREGVVDGLRSVSQFISGIQEYRLATELLITRVRVGTGESGPKTATSAQILTLLDESYKNLSAIQADITKGNPIFDSLFGVDGLSTQLITSTISLRETITQEKAISSLVESIFDRAGKKIVLFVSLDSRTSRPFFGIPNEVSVMTIDQGKLVSTQVYPVSDLDQLLKGKVEPPVEMKKYTSIQDWKLSNGSWSVDGPTAAREVAWFVGKQLHVDADTIVFIDTPVLSKTQSLLLPEKKETAMQGANPVTVLGAQTSASLLSEFIQDVKGESDDNLEKILPIFVQSLNASQMILFSKDPGIAKTAKSLAWDGSVRTPTCPAAFSIERTCTVLTRYLTEYDLGESVPEEEITQKNNQVHTIIVSKENLLHTDMVSYPKTRTGTESKLLKYLVDDGASVTLASINGHALSSGELAIGNEYGKTSVTLPITLSPESETVVILQYTTPAVASGHSSVVFFTQKQPGKNDDPFTLEFSFAKEYIPTIIAPQGIASRSTLSFTTRLDTSKIFAVGF